MMSAAAPIYEDALPWLPSPLDGVSDGAWTKFVRGMITQGTSSVSQSNALGMFAIMPRRLGDLGLVEKLKRAKSPVGKTIWIGSFKLPMTSDRFLRNPQMQYQVFTRSTKDYVERISLGEIEKPACMSLSGALAILHRAGPRGLENWAQREKFPATESIYARVAGLF